MANHKILISYSHEDGEWLKRVVTHLGVFRHQDLVDVWTDRRIGVGEDWYADIQAAMEAAEVAVLLVTPAYLDSDFVRREEVPRLLERRKSEGLAIIPVVVRPCAWDLVPWLKQMQLRPRDARPLASGQESQIDQDLADITREIYEILAKGHAVPGPSVAKNAGSSLRSVEAADLEKMVADSSGTFVSVPDAARAAQDFYASLREGRFEQAWRLSEHNWRLCRAQAWVWSNRHFLGLSDLSAAQEMSEELSSVQGKHPIWPEFMRIEREQFLKSFAGESGEWGMASGRRSVGPGYELFLFAPLGEHRQGFIITEPTVLQARSVLVHLTEAEWRVAAFNTQAPPQPGQPPAWWTHDPVAAVATDQMQRAVQKSGDDRE